MNGLSGLRWALDPDNNVVSVLTDADGNVVTDLAAKPATTYPISALGAHVDADGNLKVVT